MKDKIRIIQKDIIVRYMDEVKDEDLWEVQKSITISSADLGLVNVPKMFETDFASVPKFLWSAIGPVGNFNLSSVVHDYFYTTHSVSRKKADDVFLIMMDDAAPKSKIRNRLMYYSVRLFGSYRWRQYGNGI